MVKIGFITHRWKGKGLSNHPDPIWNLILLTTGERRRTLLAICLLPRVPVLRRRRDMVALAMTGILSVLIHHLDILLVRVRLLSIGTA